MDYNQWLFPRVTDYFDNRKQNNIYIFSQKIARYSSGQRKRIYAAISERIANYMEQCVKDDRTLQTIACCVVDDMYRSVNSERFFTPAIAEYLDATGRVFLEYLSRKNVALHYLCNNTFANSDALVWLFPAFFNACGIRYFSPQHIAWYLMEQEGILYQQFEREYPRYQEEARYVMHNVIVKSYEDHTHYLLVIPDGNSDDFYPATQAIGEAGVLTMFRTEAPHDSAKFEVYYFEQV